MKIDPVYPPVRSADGQPPQPHPELVKLSPRRVLIYKPSAIGDVVHTLPILNLLRRRWPEAKISWLITPACAALIENHPRVDQVFVFNRGRFGHAWRSPTASTAMFRFLGGLRRQKFDLVIDFQGLFRSGWMTWATGAPTRVGFADAREGATAFYTHRVSSGGWTHQHAIGRYLHLAAALGCDVEPIEFHFAVDDADRAYVASLLPGDSPFAVLLPGTNWLSKRWPIERYAAIVSPLRERFGLKTVIAGAPVDADLARQIPDADANLVGRTHLRQTIALLERAALVIGNDSGPVHIAAALGRPLVALYGPTNPLLTGPYGRDDAVLRQQLVCSPCLSRTCSHQSCLQWIGIEPALRLARRQMAMAK